MCTRVITLVVALMLSLPAAAQTHPNETIYRYRVKDGVLQAPWQAYPEGRERARWDCFDGQSGRTIDCSLASGSLERFPYIFRYRYLDDRSTGGIY